MYTLSTPGMIIPVMNIIKLDEVVPICMSFVNAAILCCKGPSAVYLAIIAADPSTLLPSIVSTLCGCCM